MGIGKALSRKGSQFILLSLLFLFVPAATFGGGTIPTGTQPTLLVGGDHNYPPYEFLEIGEPSGFNIELIRAVAEVMGFDVEIKLGPWNEVREDLEQGNIDVLAGMYYSQARDKTVDFSIPHTMVSPGLFVRNDSPIRAFGEVQNREIIVQKGDIMHDLLQREGIASRIIAVTDPPEALRLLASGEHDAALLSSKVQGLYFISEFKLANVTSVEVDLEPGQYCFAVTEGNEELIHKLNEGLNTLKATGEYKEIYDRWFGVYEQQTPWETRKYFVWALGLITALLTASLLWSWGLRRQVARRTRELQREIAEGKLAEEALRESEERYRSLFDNSLNGFALHEIVTNAEGRPIDYVFLTVNRAFEELTSLNADEIIGKRATQVLPGIEKDPFIEIYGQVALTGEPTRFEQLATPLGRWYDIAAFSSHQGRFATIFTDVTERKQVEEKLKEYSERLEEMVNQRTAELNERVMEVEELNCAMNNLLEDLQAANRKTETAAAELQEVNKELEDFAYVVSHDLKAPLRAITQLAGWISADYADALDEEGQELLCLLIGRTKRMHNLIEGILQYSRIGRIKERERSVDLNRLVRETIEVLAPPEHIHITVEDELPTVVGEPTRLGQVFQNLLDNAIKFIDKPEGQVSIGCVDEGAHWRFRVTDNGPGIAEQYYPQVFQIFQTLSPRDEFESTGIGLALVKRIVETWGGKIWLESTTGEGSTFFFTLPKKGKKGKQFENEIH